MRGQLLDIELRIDRRDAQKLTRLQGEATQYTEAATKHRTTAAAARTERARRADMAKRHPELYDIETKARHSYAAQQKRAAIEQSRARAQESAGYHRTPPTQGRGGPSAGRQ
ncbi:hypothetical protein ACIRD0_37235 [Streptomyces microflavus]|uniref:hypothetical protein n=1 Tax=Streptomyces microflavus TaxID=1919 RepID=UPI00380ECF35